MKRLVGGLALAVGVLAAVPASFPAYGADAKWDCFGRSAYSPNGNTNTYTTRYFIGDPSTTYWKITCWLQNKADTGNSEVPGTRYTCEGNQPQGGYGDCGNTSTFNKESDGNVYVCSHAIWQDKDGLHTVRKDYDRDTSNGVQCGYRTSDDPKEPTSPEAPPQDPDQPKPSCDVKIGSAAGVTLPSDRPQTADLVDGADAALRETGKNSPVIVRNARAPQVSGSQQVLYDADAAGTGEWSAVSTASFVGGPNATVSSLSCWLQDGGANRNPGTAVPGSTFTCTPVDRAPGSSEVRSDRVGSCGGSTSFDSDARDFWVCVDVQWSDAGGSHSTSVDYDHDSTNGVQCTPFAPEEVRTLTAGSYVEIHRAR